MNAPASDIPPEQFAWDAERRAPVLLIGFIALSAFAHIAAFFLFQATYPAHVTIPPPAAQMTILSADVPEHRPILSWIAAEDPALGASISKARPPAVASVPYKPSYETLRTWPLPPPVVFEPVPMPDGRSGFELIQSLIPRATHGSSAPIPSPTTVSVFGDLASRPMHGNAVFKITSPKPLTSLQFMLGVDAAGKVRNVFVQRSSGELQVDSTAMDLIRKLSFAPDSREITWGFLAITWGDDVYAGVADGTAFRRP